MSLRDSINEAVAEMVNDQFPNDDIPSDVDGQPVDEVVAAIQRQLDVYEGTLVMLTNACTLAHLQLKNLRAEVELLTTPVPAQGYQPAPPTKVERTPSGAIPGTPDMPDWCGHPDVLLVPTANGTQRVCPDCQREAERAAG